MELTEQLTQDGRRGQATGAVLRALGTGALITASLVAPNAASTFAPLISKRETVSLSRAERALRHSINRGWVIMKDTDDGVEVALTSAGRIKWQSVQLEQPLSSQRWDNKWRLVVFDIPDRRKLAREALRTKLKRLGLIQFQKSVWITPYDCSGQVLALRELYEISPYVRLIVATGIEGERQLKARFGLS